MKKISLIFALLAANQGFASSPEPSWSNWNANVWNTYCELRRGFDTFFRSNEQGRGFLASTVFNKAFIRFAASTQTHYGLIPEEKLGIIRFELYVYPIVSPVARDDELQSANLGGFDVAVQVNVTGSIHIFSLPERQSAILLQRFMGNQLVEFSLNFVSGDTRNFKIYPSGDRNFHVWAAMFKTCIRENVDRT